LPFGSYRISMGTWQGNEPTPEGCIAFCMASTPSGTESFPGRDICSPLPSRVVRMRSYPIDPLRTFTASSTTLEIEPMSSLRIDVGVPPMGLLHTGMGR
jgi:hypothetical protein